MTTQPATINFRMYPDATFSEVTTLLDSEGDPVDLSAKTALMHIRRDRDDVFHIFELSTADGSITLAADGAITLNIPATQTYPVLSPAIDRDGEMWFHDLLITDPTTTPPTVDRLYQGSVIVFPGITKPPAP